MTSLRTLTPLLALLAAARLIIAIEKYGRESVQADFAAYYTAGESVRAGLSPYRNNFDHTPPVWDGIAQYTHSRFLYPPLAARLFVPLAGLPYGQAKVVWMIMTLVCIAGAMAMTVRFLRLDESPWARWVLIALCCVFHPLYVLFERGQIDGLTLLLLTGGAVALSRVPRCDIIGGAFLALASLFKVHGAVVLAFFVLQRRWKAAAAFTGTMVLLLLLSIRTEGLDSLERYVRHEAPRIAMYGEEGDDSMRLPDTVVASLVRGVPDRSTVKDGEQYLRSTIAFAPNASIVRLIAGVPRRFGFTLSLAVLSGVLMTIVVLMYGAVQKKGRAGASPDTVREFAFWQTVFILLMLCGPLTWAMNLVWLLPAVAIFLYGCTPAGRRFSRRPLILLGTGLLLATLPEVEFLQLPDNWLRVKYVCAQLLILGGLIPLTATAKDMRLH